MYLMIKGISEKLQTQWRKIGEDNDSDMFVHLKIFHPCGVSTWWITEQNPEVPDVLFGLYYIFEKEWGYVSLSDL